MVSSSLPAIKIVSALVNPVGSREAGKETVSIKNTGTQTINLQHWSLKNEKGKVQELNNIPLTPGQVQTISLTILRLANTGGTIAIFNETGQEVHRVQYSNSQGKLQGAEIQFT